MSSKAVYSIRLPIKYKKIIDEMDDINWQDEIREVTLKLIKQKNKQRLLKEAKSLRNQMVKDLDAATLIREDRDAR